MMPLRARFGRTVRRPGCRPLTDCGLRCVGGLACGFRDFQGPARWLTFDKIERVAARAGF